jgi:diguanylate cyclase (GGDEF)-like protein
MSTILIIDERIVRHNFLQNLLSSEEHQLLFAYNKERALTIIQTKPIDLIVTDIYSKNFDGFNFAIFLREDPIFFYIPVIFYTNSVCSKETIFLAKKCGVTHVFSTTSKTKTIITSINKILKHPNKEKFKPKLNIKLFEQFLEKIKVVFWRSSPNLNRIIYVSPAYEEIWGEPVESIYKNPTSWLEKIIPEDRQRIADEISLLYKNVVSNIDMHYRIIHQPDQTIRYIYDHGCKVNDESNDNIGVAIDVTEHIFKKRQQETNQALQLVLNITSSFEDVVTKILHVFCNTLGWDFGAIWIVGEQNKNIYLLHYITNKNIRINKPQKLFFKKGEDTLGQVWKSSKPLYIQNLSSTKKSPRIQDAINFGFNSMLAFPIVFRRKFFGIFEFFDKYAKNINDTNLLMFAKKYGTELGKFLSIKHKEIQLSNFLYTDFLTGLPTRIALEKTVDQIFIPGAIIKHTKIGFLMLDLDQFSLINDNFGQDAGDIFLKLVGARLLGIVKKNNLLARINADKFILLVPEIKNIESLIEYARKILEVIQEPIYIQDQPVYLTTSIGIVMYPDDGKTYKLLQKKCHIAISNAKAKGPNNIQLYRSKMMAKNSELLNKKNLIHSALLNNDFFLVFQPKLEIDSNRITGFEALLRLTSQDKNNKHITFLPSQFIHIAEESGLMISIGDWVLHHACEFCKFLHTKGFPSIKISINVSGKQFLDVDFTKKLSTIICQSGLNPQSIILEITENVLLEENLAILSNLAQINHLGIKISLDDFGTGFSSFNYIKKIQVYEIKIDRSFIQEIIKNTDNIAIVKAIIAMAHQLGIKVVCEGVENVDQKNFLEKNNCDEMQGFYISKPLPAKSVIPFLEKYKSKLASSLGPARTNFTKNK